MVIFNKIKLRFESLVNKLYRVENVGVLSDKLEVTAALVFGDTGRKVYSKIAKNTLPNERVAGKIVGYEIKNITDSDVFFIDYNLIPGGSYLFTLEQLNYRVTMEDIKCVMSNGVWIKSTGGVDLMYFVPKDRKKLKEVQIVENVKSRWILKKDIPLKFKEQGHIAAYELKFKGKSNEYSNNIEVGEQKKIINQTY